MSLTPPPSPVRRRFDVPVLVFAVLAVLRIAFVFRRPELIRSIGDVVLGTLAGLVVDAAAACLVSVVLLVLARFSLVVARVAGAATLFGLVAMQAVETEYFAWSHARFDRVFLVYAREVGTLGGSVRGEISFPILVFHAVVAVVAIALLWRRIAHVAEALVPTAAIAMVLVAVSTLMPIHPDTWLGTLSMRTPLGGLVRAARAEDHVPVEDAELRGSIEETRRFFNPVGAKSYPSSATPITHRDAVPTSPTAGPNVIVLMLEGFGAANLKASGGAGNIAPELDAWAEKGLYFRHFFANGAHTPRAMDATICSLVPRLVGAPLSRAQPAMPVRCLPAILRDHGYRTAFLHGGKEAFENRFEFLGRIGFHDLVFFEDFGDVPTSNGGWGVTDAETYARALQWVDGRDRNRPFFLTVLSISNHHPFHVPDPELEVEHDESKRSLNTLRYTAREAGRFLDALQTRGVLDDTLVFVLGDHGLTRSNLAAEGTAALPGIMLSRANVPLLVLGWKNGTPHVVDSLVSQVDLLPTVLEALAIPATTHAVGTSLSVALGGKDLPVLLHDVYSGLVADVTREEIHVRSVEDEGVTPMTARWSRGADGRLTAEVTGLDSVASAKLGRISHAVTQLYATESWWRPGQESQR